MTKNDFKAFLATSKNAFFDGNTLPKALKMIENLKDESILKDLSDVLIFKKSYSLNDFSEELENLIFKKAQNMALKAKIKFKNEAEKNAQKLSEYELLTLYFYKKIKG